jgi:nuclear transport factor 2 (NTF2) superfamily protein
MQKNIKKITEVLILQQRNILKGAMVITGIILIYTLLFLPTAQIEEKNKIVGIDSVKSNSDSLDLNNYVKENVVPVINEDIKEDIEIPELVPEVISPIETKKKLSNNESLEVVNSFFNSYNSRNFATACEFLSSNKCNPESISAVNRLAAEYEKMINGYEDVKVWLAKDVEDFHSDVICVKYSYQYKDDVKKKRIYERMSFYVKENEEGKKEITTRVCEKKFADMIGEVPCPILSKKDFCLE